MKDEAVTSQGPVPSGGPRSTSRLVRVGIAVLVGLTLGVVAFGARVVGNVREGVPRVRVVDDAVAEEAHNLASAKASLDRIGSLAGADAPPTAVHLECTIGDSGQVISPYADRTWSLPQADVDRAVVELKLELTSAGWTMTNPGSGRTDTTFVGPPDGSSYTAFIREQSTNSSPTVIVSVLSDSPPSCLRD